MIPIGGAIAAGSASLAGSDCDYFRERVPAAAQNKISQRFSGTLSATGLKPDEFWTDQNTYTFGAMVDAVAAAVAVAAFAWIQCDLDFSYQSGQMSLSCCC